MKQAIARATVKAKPPATAQATLGGETRRVLARRLATEEPRRVRLLDDLGQTPIKLAATVVGLAVRTLDEIAWGNAGALIPVPEDGKMAYRRAGTHRRVRLADVLAYKRRADEDRRATLVELAAYDQELGI